MVREAASGLCDYALRGVLSHCLDRQPSYERCLAVLSGLARSTIEYVSESTAGDLSITNVKIQFLERSG
jgi:hypothetical protein